MLDPKYNIAIFGHAKHGKSTVGGRLLYEYNGITDREIAEYEVIADGKGKDYNKFNILFLQRNTAVWRERENVIGDDSRTTFPEIGNVTLENGQQISFVDTPGHLKWISNIVYGAYLADQAIITIAANEGIEKGTMEIIKILNGFSIPILGVLITKMDIVNYSEEIYNDIVSDLNSILFDRFKIDLKSPIIPISAIENEGISYFSKINWYKGKTLKSLIENNKNYSTIDNSKDVRFIVEGGRDVYSVPSVGTIVVGTLEFGNLSIGDEIILQPASFINDKVVKYKIKNIQYAKSVIDKRKKENLSFVKARNIISVLLSDADSDELKKHLKRGGVFSLSKPTIANEIIAEVSFFEPDKIYNGKECIFHSNASYSTAIIKSIANNEKIDNKMVSINNSNLELILSFKSPICIESDINYNRLTRFLLRKDNKIIGCGICKEIKK